DFGLDVGFMDNRFNILFDYYNRRTDDLITNLTLPPSTGFSSISTNLGSLQNKVIELELNADILLRTSELGWNVVFNISTTKNIIFRLHDYWVFNKRDGSVSV